MRTEKQKVTSVDSILRKLTFDELHDWAGEKIPNRGKGYVKRVALQITSNGDDNKRSSVGDET